MGYPDQSQNFTDDELMVLAKAISEDPYDVPAEEAQIAGILVSRGALRLASYGRVAATEEGVLDYYEDMGAR